jgi:O-antigen/teichoic acid export membrane protein
VKVRARAGEHGSTVVVSPESAAPEPDETASRARSLPRSFRRSALANYANAGISIILAIVVTPVLVRGLGKEAYGTWTLVTSSVVYFNLLQLGFGQSTVRFVAEAQAVGDLARARRLVSTSIVALSIPGLALLLASPALGFAIPEIFHVGHGLRTAAIVVTILSAVDLAVSLPADTFGATLAAFQRWEMLNLTVVATALAQAISWVIILALGGGLVLIAASTLTFSLASQVMRYRIAGRLVQGPLLRRSQVDRSLVRPILRFSGWIAVTDFAATVIDRLDVVVIGLVLGVRGAAVYAVGQKLGALTSKLTDPVVIMFYPHASELAAVGDHEGLRASVFAGLRMSTAIALPVTITLCVLARPAIHAWVGTGYAEATWVVVFLSLSTLAFSIDRIPIFVLRGLGDAKLPAVVSAAEAVLNLGLSVGLAFAIGIAGVALATVIAHILTSFCFALPVIFRRIGISVRSVVWLLLRHYAIPAALQLAAGIVLLKVGVNGLIEVMGAGAAMVLVFVAAAAVFSVSPDERQVVVARVVGLCRTTLASD